MEEQTSRLVVSPTEVRWKGISVAEVVPRAITLAEAGGGEVKWKIRWIPWWLQWRRKEGRLILVPKNCGNHRGQVRLQVDGVRIHIRASSAIPGGISLYFRGAIQGILPVYIAAALLVLFLYFLLEKFQLAPIYSLPFSHWHYDILTWMDDFFILGLSLIWGWWMGGWRFALRTTVVTYLCVKVMPFLLRTLPAPSLSFYTLFEYGEYPLLVTILKFFADVGIIGLLWGFLMGGRWWLAIRSAVAGAVAGSSALLIVALLVWANLPRPPRGTDVFPSDNQIFWWMVAGITVSAMIFAGGISGFLAKIPHRREKVDEGKAQIPDSPESTVNPIEISPLQVRWGPLSSDRATEKEVVFSEGGETPSHWKVSNCPWWLDARTEANRLILRVKHCGPHAGYVWVSVREAQVGIPVSSRVFAEKSLWIFGFYKGIVVALVGLFFAYFLNVAFSDITSFTPWSDLLYKFDLWDLYSTIQTSIQKILPSWLRWRLYALEVPIHIRAIALLGGSAIAWVWGRLVGGRKLMMRSTLGGLVSGYILFWGATIFLMPQGWLFSARELGEWSISNLLTGGLVMGIAGAVWGRFVSGWEFSWRAGILWGLSAIAGLLTGMIGDSLAEMSQNWMVIESYNLRYSVLIPIVVAVLLSGGLVGALIPRLPQPSS